MDPATPLPGACSPPPPVAAGCAKVRLRFRKSGDLRFLSHHDLCRCFERMLRRASLPFRSSGGFHPQPRLVFALSLPLGVVGCAEVVELELTQPLAPDEVRERLAAQAPPGLEILSVRSIALRTTAHVRGLCYRVPVPTARVPGVSTRLAALEDVPAWEVEPTRPTRRRLDLRPLVCELRLLEGPALLAAARPALLPDAAGRVADRPALLEVPCASPAPGPVLEMDLWLTASGTARPDEVLALVGLEDLLPAGAILERTRLDLEDEIPLSSVEGPA